MAIDSWFWKNKRVFMTGHSGFKGGWLSMWLNHLGAKVTGYSLAPDTNPSLYDLLGLERKLTSHIGDIRDYSKLEECILQCDPEVIFHLAAQPLVRESYRDPLGTYSTNVMGTANVLECARRAKNLKSIVVVTTDKVYENYEKDYAYKEEDRLGGYDPYSNSKACAELVVSAYRNSFFNTKNFSTHGVCLASARAGNVIGGGDWSADRLLPDLARSSFAGEVLNIRNPQAVRPWQHVLDSLAGYLLLAQRGLEQGTPFSQAFNFGPMSEDCVDVRTICKYFQKVWPRQSPIIYDDSHHLHEAQLLKLDNRKAISTLQWGPRLNIEAAIHWTAQWYQTILAKPFAAEQFTLTQIQQYTGKLPS